MTKDKLNDICKQMRNLWTCRKGCTAIMRSSRDSELYRICCGSMSNPYLMAETCRIWKGESQIYNGKLQPAEIAKVINVNNICSVDYYTASRRDKLLRQVVRRC